MRTLTLLLLVSMVTAPLAGCFVRSGPSHRHSSARGSGGNSCGPAHHWNGHQCVHNGNKGGNGKGHGNGKHK